jgi:hypothetical protein
VEFLSLGILLCLAASFLAWKLKIIRKSSNLLFLHFGFYRHFFKIIFSAFFPSLKIAFRAAIASKEIDPKVFHLKVKKLNKKELLLLAPTLNLMAGLLFVRNEDEKISILSLYDECIFGLNLEEIIANLDQMHDVSLNLVE